MRRIPLAAIFTIICTGLCCVGFSCLPFVFSLQSDCIGWIRIFLVLQFFLSDFTSYSYSYSCALFVYAVYSVHAQIVIGANVRCKREIEKLTWTMHCLVTNSTTSSLGMLISVREKKEFWINSRWMKRIESKLFKCILYDFLLLALLFIIQTFV